MNALHDVVAKHKFPLSDKVFAHSEQYVNFVTMETITSELLRNILLALLCVFLATLLLMAHLFVSLMVVLNVAMTLVNVAGCMWFWGLSIETAAAILLTISLGLAVDYSAHVAHAFMSTPGESRNERMRRVIIACL
jgi:Niemann-Pick C1 protein